MIHSIESLRQKPPLPAAFRAAALTCTVAIILRMISLIQWQPDTSDKSVTMFQIRRCG
jgi:hypothetical protein